MGGKKKKYNARFPPARIKKIMQTDEEIGKIAAPVPVVISRALELFLESLISKSVSIADEHNAKTLASSHIKSVINSNQNFDFLKSQVSLVPDLTNPEGGDGTSTDKLNRNNSTDGATSLPSTSNATSSGADSTAKKRSRPIPKTTNSDGTESPGDSGKALKKKRGRPPKMKQEVNGDEIKGSSTLASPAATVTSSSIPTIKSEPTKQEANSKNGHTEPGQSLDLVTGNSNEEGSVTRPPPSSIFTTENTVLSKQDYQSPAAHSSVVMTRYPMEANIGLKIDSRTTYTSIESMYHKLSPTSLPMDLSSKPNNINVPAYNTNSAFHQPVPANNLPNNSSQAVNLSRTVNNDDDYDAS